MDRPPGDKREVPSRQRLRVQHREVRELLSDDANLQAQRQARRLPVAESLAVVGPLLGQVRGDPDLHRSPARHHPPVLDELAGLQEAPLLRPGARHLAALAERGAVKFAVLLLPDLLQVVDSDLLEDGVSHGGRVPDSELLHADLLHKVRPVPHQVALQRPDERPREVVREAREVVLSEDGADKVLPRVWVPHFVVEEDVGARRLYKLRGILCSSECRVIRLAGDDVRAHGCRALSAARLWGGRGHEVPGGCWRPR